MPMTKVRRTRIEISLCETRPSWNESRIIFTDRSGPTEPREVTLVVKNPYDLNYLEEQIEKIRKYWKQQLGVE